MIESQTILPDRTWNSSKSIRFSHVSHTVQNRTWNSKVPIVFNSPRNYTWSVGTKIRFQSGSYRCASTATSSSHTSALRAVERRKREEAIQINRAPAIDKAAMAERKRQDMKLKRELEAKRVAEERRVALKKIVEEKRVALEKEQAQARREHNDAAAREKARHRIQLHFKDFEHMIEDSRSNIQILLDERNALVEVMKANEIERKRRFNDYINPLHIYILEIAGHRRKTSHEVSEILMACLFRVLKTSSTELDAHSQSLTDARNFIRSIQSLRAYRIACTQKHNSLIKKLEQEIEQIVSSVDAFTAQIKPLARRRSLVPLLYDALKQKFDSFTAIRRLYDSIQKDIKNLKTVKLNYVHDLWRMVSISMQCHLLRRLMRWVDLGPGGYAGNRSIHKLWIEAALLKIYQNELRWDLDFSLPRDLLASHYPRLRPKLLDNEMALGMLLSELSEILDELRHPVFKTKFWLTYRDGFLPNLRVIRHMLNNDCDKILARFSNASTARDMWDSSLPDILAMSSQYEDSLARMHTVHRDLPLVFADQSQNVSAKWFPSTRKSYGTETREMFGAQNIIQNKRDIRYSLIEDWSSKALGLLQKARPNNKIIGSLYLKALRRESITNRFNDLDRKRSSRSLEVSKSSINKRSKASVFKNTSSSAIDIPKSSRSIITENAKSESKIEKLPLLLYQKDDDLVEKSKYLETVLPVFSHKFYFGPGKVPVELFYCQSLEESEKVAKLFQHEPILGFDLEWNPYTRRDGPLKSNVSLLQLASPSKIALFHFSMHSGDILEMILSKELRKILESTNQVKVGVNILNDFQRLNRYMGINPQGAIELSHIHNLITSTRTQENTISKNLISLSRQTVAHLNMSLKKFARIRMSKWDLKLNKKQIEYAADDAYVALHIFHAMEMKRLKMKNIPPRPSFAELKLPILTKKYEISSSVESESSQSEPEEQFESDYSSYEDEKDDIEDSKSTELGQLSRKSN